MKFVFMMVGIDIFIFKFYSIRVVFVSVVYVLRIFVDIILRIVGWFSELIFRKFYNKDIILNVDMSKRMLENYM